MKAVELFKYVKNNYPDLNIIMHQNLFINLLYCENPIQALDIIIKNNKIAVYTGKSDLKKILLLGQQLDYDEDLNYFFEFLRKVLVNNETGKPTHPNTISTYKDRVANQLDQIINDKNSIKILKNNPQIIDLILKKPYLIKRNFLPLLLLINYHFVNFSLSELKALNDKRIRFLLEDKEIFKNWHVDVLKYIFLHNLKEKVNKGNPASVLYYLQKKINRLKNHPATSEDEGKFIYQLVKNSSNVEFNDEIDKAFDLIGRFGIPFIKKCYEYYVINTSTEHISMLSILTTFYHFNEVESFLTGRDLNSADTFNELVEKFFNNTGLEPTATSHPVMPQKQNSNTTTMNTNNNDKGKRKIEDNSNDNPAKRIKSTQKFYVFNNLFSHPANQHASMNAGSSSQHMARLPNSGVANYSQFFVVQKTVTTNQVGIANHQSEKNTGKKGENKLSSFKK